LQADAVLIAARTQPPARGDACRGKMAVGIGRGDTERAGVSRTNDRANGKTDAWSFRTCVKAKSGAQRA
jgi:hypothetical protein